MSLAILFPGQGSQKTGMGLDLYEHTVTGKELFDEIDSIAGRKISEIIFRGPDSELNQTKNTQIAILAVSIILSTLIKEKIKDERFQPAAVCGHSLGESTALWYTGILNLKEVISLVLIRGKLMQNAPPGGMAAVLNVPAAKINEILNMPDFKDKLVVANYNSPSQLVISGEKESINKLPEFIKQFNGKTIILPVSGAFHSSLMTSPSEKFNQEINNLLTRKLNNTSIPIYQNTDASASCHPSEIINKLKKQMTSPVYWTQTINNLVKDGVTEVVEIGPGKVLTGLTKKINPNLGLYNINDLASLNEFVKNYGSHVTKTSQVT